MHKYERPLLIVAIIFMIAMAVIGWYTVVRVKFEPAVVTAAVIGSVATGGGIYGMSRDSAYFVAGGALGAGLLFPTTFGYIPMIIGFVLFILIVSLRMFTSTFEN
ncbi:hypothetical protein [Trueperella bialowiezensis]|uniref:Uncharacterized protein n=1 Tax=Trueperella bialowiezensis TaxID=312285 RepID=A0A448PGC9_9ACTO|nr:hypothetical protein [Trueperella bialowiezensis]VEI14007.1 Uncharacterised protein [Trueperella bialowiezensis]